MENERDSNPTCNLYTRYSHERIGIATGRLGNKRTSGDHPNYSIIENGQNTQKSPGDMKRLDEKLKNNMK